MDESTHKPVAILKGRDGKTSKNWLKSNQQVRTITRDRASAYAKTTGEELPDTIQIAGRFHLHQKLLEAIKKSLNREIPASILVIECRESSERETARRMGLSRSTVMKYQTGAPDVLYHNLNRGVFCINIGNI